MQKEDLIRILKNQGFSQRILSAFERVERKDFIPEKYKTEGYRNIPLPIGKGQTISQPYTIAFMLSMLELGKNQKILEIGSGSGYVLALISEISVNSKIYGIERIKELAEISQEVLKKRKNISIIYGDGSKGLPKESEKSLFDRILISASSDKLPQNLFSQLKIGGVLVAPVKRAIVQVKKFANENRVREFPGFVFVPLVKERKILNLNSSFLPVF